MVSGIDLHRPVGIPVVDQANVPFESDINRVAALIIWVAFVHVCVAFHDHVRVIRVVVQLIQPGVYHRAVSGHVLSLLLVFPLP